jgi:N-acetylglutamate synthase-like GNAT family acetyltransferase
MASPSRASGSGALKGVTIRTELRPGDLGAIVSMHGLVYAKEHGFDHTFEAYVAGPLAECVRSALPGDRIWLAEKDGRIAGSVAIVGVSQEIAQLRWFLVDPGERGSGLGMTLLHEAVAFSKECGYRSIILWTVSALSAAAHLYLKAGFRKVEEVPGRKWGVSVIEEKYEKALR